MPMKIIIPFVTPSKRIVFNPKSKTEELSKSLCNNKDNKSQTSFYFKSKKLLLNKKTNRYYLHFNGQVNMTSCRNFQIVKDDGENNDEYNEEIYLQFGKITNESYHLAMKYPFSPFQGFCIALTKFDL